jgi:hypothetical protein
MRPAWRIGARPQVLGNILGFRELVTTTLVRRCGGFACGNPSPLVEVAVLVRISSASGARLWSDLPEIGKQLPSRRQIARRETDVVLRWRGRWTAIHGSVLDTTLRIGRHPPVLRLLDPMSTTTGPFTPCPHSRRPPRKALSLLPSCAPGGSSLSFLLLPPPRTT